MALCVFPFHVLFRRPKLCSSYGKGAFEKFWAKTLFFGSTAHKMHIEFSLYLCIYMLLIFFATEVSFQVLFIRA